MKQNINMSLIAVPLGVVAERYSVDSGISLQQEEEEEEEVMSRGSDKCLL